MVERLDCARNVDSIQSKMYAVHGEKRAKPQLRKQCVDGRQLLNFKSDIDSKTTCARLLFEKKIICLWHIQSFMLCAMHVND